MMMAGSLQIVELPRMRHLADIGEILHAEGVLLLAQEFVDRLVEALRVQAIDLGGVHAQRAVHKDRHPGQLARQRQLVQRINDLLRAADRERGDDDLALSVQRLAHQLADLGIGACLRRVHARAVGALDLQVIHVLHRLRVAQNVVVAAADVAAEQIAKLAPVLANVEHHLRRAEDVAGVAERHRHAVRHRKRAVIVDADKLADGLVGILGGVKRFDRRQAMLGALLRDEGGVIALDLSRILQHDARQVARGERAIDVALEPLAAQVRQVAAVINVRVAQHDGVDLLWVEREIAVALDGFAAPALEQAALQQKPLTIQLKEIERPGGRASGAEEVNPHSEEIAASNIKVERKVTLEPTSRSFYSKNILDNGNRIATVPSIIMKDTPLTTILLGVLTLSALASIVLCWVYISNTRELRTLQAQAAQINTSRAVITALVNDTVEYSKTHPAIEPLLESVGLKPGKSNPATTNKAATK